MSVSDFEFGALVRGPWSVLGPTTPWRHRVEVEMEIMSTATHDPHLTFDGDGTARIERSRYKVLHLAGEHYHYGWTADEMLRQGPYLTFQSDAGTSLPWVGGSIALVSTQCSTNPIGSRHTCSFSGPSSSAPP